MSSTFHYQLCFTRYTAVQIKNYSKSTSVIKVYSHYKKYGWFPLRKEAITCYCPPLFRCQQWWMEQKGGECIVLGLWHRNRLTVSTSYIFKLVTGYFSHNRITDSKYFHLKMNDLALFLSFNIHFTLVDFTYNDFLTITMATTSIIS